VSDEYTSDLLPKKIVSYFDSTEAYTFSLSEIENDADLQKILKKAKLQFKGAAITNRSQLMKVVRDPDGLTNISHPLLFKFRIKTVKRTNKPATEGYEKHITRVRNGEGREGKDLVLIIFSHFLLFI